MNVVFFQNVQISGCQVAINNQKGMRVKITLILTISLFSFALSSCGENKRYPDYDEKAAKKQQLKEKCVLTKRLNQNLPECANEN